MQIRVLGPIDAIDDEGINVPLGGPAQLRLLALLVAASPASTAVDDLVHELWADEERPDDPTGTVRTYVARLRRALGPEAITTATGAYALGSIATDVGRFEELLERARRMSGSPAAPDLWRQALDLWRGQAFDTTADLDSIRPRAARLEELRAEATEAWFDARLAAGEARELAGDVETAISRFPLREGFRAQQMTVLARAGRQADALRAFQDFRAEMTEVGLDPGSRLVELDAEIARGAVPRAGARRILRGYELGERIDEGAFAQVWTATQASVDRTVAIKQIRGELADQPAFITQFEAEAQLVARLEHPYIVPLYDFWREPGSAYLVMRYLDGGSLAGRLVDRPAPLEDAVRWIGQVAAGLDTAHRAGVIHRDVKPANLLLDREGNAYLSDFGIAVEEAERLDPEAWLSNGSPAYAAPEQLQRQSVGPAADIYALGITLYETLTGQLPFPGETTMAGLLQRQLNDPMPLVRSIRPELPAAVDTVLQRATAKNATDRYSTAGDFARDLASAAGVDDDQALVTPEDRNPYKGLQAFDEADAGDFTGRDRLTNEILRSVDQHRLVVVVGPSGSGKSSVVKAGLVPALRSGRLPASARWFVADMAPGSDPFAVLEAALLTVAVDPPVNLLAELRGDRSGPGGPGNDGLARVLRRIVPDGRELVLVIDQLEELFTLTSQTERERFVEMLTAAVTDKRSRIRVVATLRADFYDQPLRDPDLARLIRPATVPVHPLAADELERAITEPAAAVGAMFEPGLVARLTAAVNDQPGALPLLQYTLTELFERRHGDLMTLSAFDELGGLAGAVGRRADELYENVDAAEQAALRRLFGRLVNLGEGTEDTRRRVRRSELPADDATNDVIDRFGNARLLAFDRDRSTREPTIEVAHEALLRAWPRLRAWLDEDRDDLRLLRHLGQTATAWDERGRDDGDLYRAGRLESASEWTADHPGELNEAEAEFLTASEARSEAERATETGRVRRLRRLLAYLAVVAAVAVIAGGLALVQRNRADERATEAELAAIVARSAAEATARPEVGLLLAAEAYNRDEGAPSQRALLTALAAVPNRVRTVTGPGGITSPGCVATVAPGRYIGGQSPTAVLDASGESKVLPIDGECFVAVSPNGDRMAYGTLPSGVAIADAETGEILATALSETPVNNLSWSADGRSLTVGLGARNIDRFANEELVTVDVSSGEVIDTFAVGVSRNHEWLADGRFLADTLVGRRDGPAQVAVVISDRPGGETLASFPGHADPITALDVALGSELVATADATGTVRVWDDPSGELAALIETGLEVASVSLAGTGERLLLASGAGVWEVDVRTQRLLREFATFPATVLEVDHLDDGTVAVLLSSGQIAVIDPAMPSTATEAVACCGDGIGSNMAPDNAMITAFDQRAGDVVTGHALIDPATGERVEIDAEGVGLGDAGPIVALPERRAVLWDSGGEFVYLDRHGEVTERAWPFGEGRTVRILNGERTGTRVASFVVLDDLDVEVPTGFAVIDLPTGEMLGEIISFDPEQPVTGWASLPDGSFVGVTVQGEIWRWTTDGARSDAPLATGVRRSIRTSPDSWLVSFDDVDGGLVVVDARTGDEVYAAPGLGGTMLPAVGPDGRHLVLLDLDGQAILHDLVDGTEIGPLADGSSGPTRAQAVFAEDGSAVWLATGDSWREYPLDPAWWQDQTCDLAGRDLTDAEWTEFVPNDAPRIDICG